ncbi:conserved exported hypothetical protein [Alteromonas sp. 38]|uniref:heparin lyase I family protein n=1 Tax=unclassified Alteromonas TaxID=2614992 RepID=UPI0012F3F373|nr:MULTISPECIES: heparin lyase I family protein [unclassified Alteromonas]CAD5254109.1 conserved exported hypothetical protein [Alteromonas sp. 154]VXB05788.1 conserved exported hypothetical protein [Alteromonas sp. 38]
MLFHSKVCRVILLTTCLVSANTFAKTFYRITAEDNEGAMIRNPSGCGSNISDGNGDLLEGGDIYRGKCDGAGNSPEIGGTHEYQKYLKFSTDPTVSNSGNDRSELALTARDFPFNENLYVGFRMMIPSSADIANKSYYLMQLWQCSPQSPISGIRVTGGTSHRINFMTRRDSGNGASFVHYDLVPNVWHDFVYKINVNPTGEGSVSVWKDEDGQPTGFLGSFGYYSDGKCEGGGEPNQSFRLKFGIYKGNESGKYFEVQYDDIRIGNYYRDVKPW